MFTRKSARPQNRPRKARSVPWPVALAATVVLACTTVTPTGALWQVRAEAKATVQTGISAIRVRGEEPDLSEKDINDWLANPKSNDILEYKIPTSIYVDQDNDAAVGYLVDARQEGRRAMYYRVAGFSGGLKNVTNAWLYRTPLDAPCVLQPPDEEPKDWDLIYQGVPESSIQNEWFEIVPRDYGVGNDVDANGRDKLCLNLRITQPGATYGGVFGIIIERNHIPSQ